MWYLVLHELQYIILSYCATLDPWIICYDKIIQNTLELTVTVIVRLQEEMSKDNIVIDMIF